MSIGTLKHGIRGLFKTGKGGKSKSSSSGGNKLEPEMSIAHSVSHETIDTVDAESDTSSLGEYDMVGYWEGREVCVCVWEGGGRRKEIGI